MRKNLLIFLMLVLTTMTVGGSIYKWVDEKGAIHYSETPPLNQKARKLETVTPPSAGAERDTQPTKIWQQQEEELRQRQQAREREAKEKEQAELWKADAKKVTYLALEFGGRWILGIGLEQQCQEQYNLSCDALLDWKNRAIQKCKDDRGSDQDCADPAYLLRFKPRTIEEQRQRAIQQRARERR